MEHDMEQRFAVLDDGARLRIYKVPINQTARLANEITGRKVEVFETLNDARETALALFSRDDASAKPSIAVFSRPATFQLRKALSELTEDRVERYFFV